MTEARRTIGRWLLAALLERGGDPWHSRVSTPVPRVRPVSRAELLRIAGPLAPVRRLRPRRAPLPADARREARLLDFPPAP